jgi:hypothetical protein
MSAVDSLAGFNPVDELITRPPYMTHTIRIGCQRRREQSTNGKVRRDFVRPLQEFHSVL